MPSAMKREYASLPKGASVNRSRFDLGRRHLTTFHGGWLVPINWFWVFPADVVSANFQAFIRASSPLDFPLMDNLKLTIHSYFVPLRIVWDNWEKFNGAQDNPADSIDYTCPTMTSTTGTGYAEESLHDYLGIPTKVPDLVHDSFWHRAYNLIWNEWFRDQNLQDSLLRS